MNTKCLFLLLLMVLMSVSPLPAKNDGDLLLPADGLSSLEFLSSLEKEVAVELNTARSHPKQYATYLEDFKRFYAGRYIYIAGQTQITTQEGAAAVDEAIKFLRFCEPLPPLKISRGLSLAAQAHAKDQGLSGLTGHQGSDMSMPDERMNRFGSLMGTFGENIEYGNILARQIVMQLIIDDGVPERGHRENIFNGSFHLMGISCGPHHAFGKICVIDFADKFEED